MDHGQGMRDAMICFLTRHAPRLKILVVTPRFSVVCHLGVGDFFDKGVYARLTQGIDNEKW
jgi:hypothetical protein